jgi:hypothetical protein
LIIISCVVACITALKLQNPSLKCKKLFFSKEEVNTVKAYSLSDSYLYDYSWRISGDEFESGLWQTSIEYGKAQGELFGFEVGEKNPHLEFTVADGQIIDKPIAILVLPTTAVPPERVRFYIDEKLVYEMPKITSPDLIHVAVKGAYQLYGTARYVNEGPEFEEQAAWVNAAFEKMGMPITAKGGVFVSVDAVYSSNPGPTAGDQIA